MIRLAARDTDRTTVRLLHALSHGPLSYWEVLRFARAQTHDALAALGALLDRDLITTADGRFQLTSLGRAWLAERNLDRRLDYACPRCGGHGLEVDAALGGVMEAFTALLADRPAPSAEYDQGHVTPETVMRRIALMAERGDLAGRDLLLVGDDDLTSLAAALSGLPRRICVLDVDPRIVTYVRDVARDRHWHHVEAEVYDVRDDLPAALRGQFDTFFTDPIDTVPGLLLFLSRCTQALRGPGGAGYFGLSYLEASRRKWHRVQQGVLGMGYAFTDILDGFQQYWLDPAVAREWARLAPIRVDTAPDAPFYVSALHRIELVDTPAPVYTGRVDLGPELYADEEFTTPEDGAGEG